MSFLPSNYEYQEAGVGNYTKLAEGANRLRILSSAIVGQEFWKADPEKEGKRMPVRRKPGEKILVSELEINPKTGQPEDIKEFWAFVVFNHQHSAFQIFDVTQSTIKEGFKILLESEDWGPDPRKYDIVVNRTGVEKATRYTVQAAPPKDMPEDAKKEFKKSKIDLKVLFDGGNPFEDMETDFKDSKIKASKEIIKKAEAEDDLPF